MNRLSELLLKWREGILEEAELAELNQRLSDPAARQDLIKDWVLEDDLKEVAAAQSAWAESRQRADTFACQAVAVLGANEKNTPAATPWARPAGPASFAAYLLRRVWRARWPVVGAGAALVAAAFLGWFPWREPAFAVLEAVSAGVEVRREGSALVPVPGFALRAGDEILVPAQGSATVEYAGELSRLRAQQNTRFLLPGTEGGKRVELLEGRVFAAIAPQAVHQPMILVTPHATATVLGTEFLLGVDGPVTRLEVMEGTVRLTRWSDERSLVVPAGFIAQAGASGDFVPEPLLTKPWSSQDIGPTARSGHARWEGKKCWISGCHSGRTSNWDAFHFVYQVLDGDGEIRAQILEFEGKGQGTKTGIVIRASLKGAAPTAFFRVNARRGLEFVKRRRQNETNTEVISNFGFPYWVRLVREGGMVTAYKSNDGETWEPTGVGQFDLGVRIYVGLGVTSSERPGRSSAVFDHVQVIQRGAANGSLLPADPTPRTD